MIRCIVAIYVCIWHMFVVMSVVVAVWGSVGMFRPADVVYLCLVCIL